MVIGKLSKVSGWLRRRFSKVRTSVPVMAILSDDWGADHVGFYGRETPADLRRLGDVLAAHTDASGHPAVLSANMVTMRPDFAAIHGCRYAEYSAVDTYGDRPEMPVAWAEGRGRDVFSQEFHGRDHFNNAMWLDELRAGQADFVDAFRQGRVLFKSPSWERLIAERPSRAMIAREYIDCRRSPNVPIPLPVQTLAIKEGVAAFERQFGFRPRCAVGSGAAFDLSTEMAWAHAGIAYYHAPGYVRAALGEDGEFTNEPRLYGQPNEAGLGLLIGNSEYEPGNARSDLNRAVAAADGAFRTISLALARREPVFMASHAQNYYGDEQKVSANLAGLDSLLTKLRKAFPRLLFASTRELGDLIYFPSRVAKRLGAVEVTHGITPGLFVKEVVHSLRRAQSPSEDD